MAADEAAQQRGGNATLPAWSGSVPALGLVATISASPLTASPLKTAPAAPTVGLTVSSAAPGSLGGQNPQLPGFSHWWARQADGPSACHVAGGVHRQREMPWLGVSTGSKGECELLLQQALLETRTAGRYRLVELPCGNPRGNTSRASAVFRRLQSSTGGHLTSATSATPVAGAHVDTSLKAMLHDFRSKEYA